MSERKNMFASALRERIRKLLVALKRSPGNIALFVLLAAFLEYSLQLTVISNTTAKIQGSGMGLCGFVTMLFSILGIVCHMNSFPKRKKTNIPMLALMFILFGIVILADARYMAKVSYAINREIDPIAVTANTAYITKSISVLRTNIILVSAGLLLTALLPVYKPLIKRINTSVKVEEAAEMSTIDISGEEE